MDNTPIVDEVVAPKKSVLFEVTTISKTLAAILFIVLPFIGGWVGYIYGNNNTEKEIVSNIETNIPDTEEYVPEAGYTDNPIETIDAIIDGVIVSTSSAPFYEEPIPSDIIVQAKQGYKRFTGPGYHYPTPSDYLYKDNTVFYLPVGATSTLNPMVLSSSPKSFKTFTENLALGDGTIYYSGTAFQKSKTLTMIQYDYYVSDSTIFSPEDNEPETRGLGIKTIFENVDSSTLAPVKELEGKPYTYQKDKGDGILQDSKFLYCIRTGRKITLPINIRFSPASEEWTAFDSWNNSEGQTGSITFTESSTGDSYNDRCEKV